MLYLICVYSVQLVAEAHLILHMIHLTAMCYILLMHNCNLSYFRGHIVTQIKGIKFTKNYM
jgi:hypothetical protein